MHVVHVTAEMAPHAKVGGLGDVVTGLARACLGRGHNVEIMLPVRGLRCAAVLCFDAAAHAMLPAAPALPARAAGPRAPLHAPARRCQQVLAGPPAPCPCAALSMLLCPLPPCPQYYECLPDDAIEDLKLDREFDCPKGKTWDGEFTSGTLRTQVGGPPLLHAHTKHLLPGLQHGGAAIGRQGSAARAALG